MSEMLVSPLALSQKVIVVFVVNQINGITVSCTPHQRVVQIIKNSRNKLEMTVMSAAAVAGRAARDTQAQTLSHRNKKISEIIPGNTAGKNHTFLFISNQMWRTCGSHFCNVLYSALTQKSALYT